MSRRPEMTYYLDDGPPEKANMTFSGVMTLRGRQLRRAVRNFESRATKKQGLVKRTKDRSKNG